MRQVELRPAARRDLARLERHLQRKSPRAALRMFMTLSTQILSLGDQPFKGRQGRAPDLRELVVQFGKSGYVVRYRVTDDSVIIIRIWHGLEDRP
ncbi:MAG: type II toxin-antitoxin system RelE/ParE family toxin [Caulobacterales bacterium]